MAQRGTLGKGEAKWDGSGRRLGKPVPKCR